MQAILEVAQHEGKRPLRVKVIADRQGISAKYLEQLMNRLRSAGLVEGVRGATGGYILARPASEIKLSEIVHCLEGRVTMAERGEDEPCDKRPTACVARELWMEIETAIQHVFSSMTLAHLVNKARARRSEYQI